MCARALCVCACVAHTRTEGVLCSAAHAGHCVRARLRNAVGPHVAHRVLLVRAREGSYLRTEEEMGLIQVKSRSEFDLCGKSGVEHT